VDPLEHVLSLLSVEGVVSAPLEAGGHRALASTGRLDVRCVTVVEGACWLTAEGWDEPVRAEQGDCFLVFGGRRHRIGSDLDVPAAPSYPVFRDPDGTPRPGARTGVGHDTTLAAAGFVFDADAAPLLPDVLPPVVHISAASEHAAVLWATLDPEIGAALRALHADIARPCSVRELAAIAGTRSTFALKLKAAVGTSPLDHLVRVRMHAVARALKESERTVASIAARVGYGTESAFSVAFKRIVGCAPGQYRLRTAARAVEPARAS
jgi:AraC-like DNA-binding protein